MHKDRDNGLRRLMFFFMKRQGNGNGNAIQIISLILTIIFSIVGIITANNANILIQNQNKLMEMQIFPFFNVGMATITLDSAPNKANIDGVYRRQIYVRNLGGNYYTLRCSTASYLYFDNGDQSYYIPVLSLFPGGQEYDYSTDDYKLAYTESSDNFFRFLDITNMNFNDITSVAKPYSYMEIVVFLKLEYQNCDQQVITQYYLPDKGILLPNDEGEYYFNYFDKVEYFAHI